MYNQRTGHLRIAQAAALLLLVLALLTAGPLIFSTDAQDTGKSELFIPVEQDKADLTPAQSEALNKIRRQGTTAETRLVRVRTNLLVPATPRVKLNFRDGKQFEVIQSRTMQIAGGITWVGLPGDTSASQQISATDEAVLVVRNGNVTGTVRAGNELYAVRPLGGGLHVLVRQAQKNLPPDHPPEFEERERNAPPQYTPPQAADVSDFPKTLRILVAYTPRVADSVPDIDAFINLAIAETNLGYTNSRVRIRAQLAHAYQTNYQESGSYPTDVANFRGNNDSFMDEVHDLRNLFRADVCVLLVDNGSYCGWADAVLATESTAFAAVHYECATGYYSFAHEIGHLQGARHNPEEDNAATPFSYGHGYYYQEGKWRTIMSYNCPGEDGCLRLPYWANPNIMYNGVPMGNADYSNDSRVLNETAPIITSFR